ncbi:MAG: DUF3320 domain-containing protein [Methanocorpusculum parvum]|nr:DUF3320 domain-containing protein [Methanocorpusculum parvum]
MLSPPIYYTMTTGKSDLEELRNRLLDLTLRNNLLNYKPSAARSIEIIESNLAGIYNTLILDEKGMKFHPGEKDTSSAPEEKNIWKYPIFSKSSKHTDSTLATPYTDIELRKKLYSLQNKSRTVFEEQGYPTLYLALGFVQWTENESSKQLKAPLLLLPVDLERQKIKENYTLRWTGEDPVVSLSLSAKFAEQGIELPDLGHPDTAAEVGAFFDAVEETIKSKGWTLCPEIVLDLFSFKKYVMFKDLDPASWGEDFSIEDNPLIDSIFNPTEAPAETADLPQTGECFNIVDADSSQLAVIREAKAGKNLVVEGPPGTGKSQTIANMIAEMLAAGKTVLFVSEKMAALEVVKRRLDGAGLSRFCLELHSQTAKKVEFIRELERCIQHPTSPAAEACDTTKIDALKTELSGYCSELREPIGACGFSPYDLFGIREQYRYEFESSPGRQNYRLPKVAVENASAITPEDYQAAVSALADIESYLPSILKDGETLSSHPWAETRPGMILPSDRDEIHDLTVAYRDGVERLVCAMRAVSDAAGIPLPHSETDIPLMMEICRSLTSEFTATPEILSNRLWDNTEAVDRLISRMKKLSETRRKLLGIFTPEIFDRNPARLYSEFMKYSEKNVISKLFSGDFKRLKEELRSYYGGSLPTDAVILSDLKEARNYLTDRDGWLSEERSYRSLFEPVWDGEDTDASVLFEYRNWVLAIRTMIAEGLITEQTVMHIADGTLGPGVMAGLFAELEAAAKAHSEESALLFERLGIDEVSEDITFAQMRRTADVWITEIDRLEEWSKFLSYAEVCAGTAAAQILPLIMTDKIDHDALIPAFLTGYADALLKEAYQQRPILAHFSQMPHEQKIAAFREFDLQMVSSNAKRLVQILDGNIPELFTGASRESEMGVLTGEFNRKRGHMSIRSLMTKSGSLIQKIKPCFMMSPLSVAQYLDPRSVMFDIIIFDEASQVKPEDALGALMRGRQLVVMGDSRQLPPTTFFDQIGGEESDEEEESTAGITDMESLLHVCKQSFVTKRLRWHYRSRHESLIAVSNAEFYDGTLQVFPSPMHDTEDVGLSFVHVEDSVYERGKAGVNRGEAKAVAEAVIDYYRRFPNKTLGVATFSTKQQELIRREVDLLLRDNPDVESLMRPENGEHFFVKNLETVQGDERDTMLISIGYGFDENHRLSRNFGPLNQTGGERRLNVLITRARERCVVFANFRGYDLPVESDTPDGVAALSAFLTYAETRNAAPLSAGEDISPDVADLFPETVARMLEDNGYAVARNVGCAGFRIDLAVLHPETEGVYMAGILCDGQFYWSAADARDRDRLRGQVLEGLGWNLIRIWSPEWFQHPASCTKVLLDFLVDAAKKEPLKLSVEPEIPVAEAVEEIEEEPAEEVPLSTVPSSACFVPYVCCDSCVLQSYNQFASVHDSVLQTALVEIVRAEGPISESLLIARIKELGSVPRMTAAIKERIANLVEASVAEGTLTRDAEKFYSLSGGEPTARKREGKWSISDVSLDEIALAARIVLEKQFATPMSDLIKQTAASLGFKATAQVKQRIEAGIAAASTSGLIVEENGVWKAV